MIFHWPHAFWLLLIPLVLLVRDLRRRRITPDAHPKITHATASHSSLVIGYSSFRRGGERRSRILLYLALAAATAALARPQWGRIEEPVFDQAREIIIALDLSRSMLADDVKPTRLERARLLITSLLERLKGERVGLIVFSGTAFLQSPLSADYEILREFLPLLEPGYLPEGGTNYEALLDTTLTAFGASGSADRFLIVLSDGEALTETWRKHLDDLKTKGIRVLGLGIGTGQGAMIPDGSGAFMKDERGAVVLSKLDSATLQELSTTTGGRYADASAWVDLSQLIHETVEQGKRGDFTEANHVRLAERFQWPLAAAVLLFLLSFWREFPVRPKPRPLQLAAKATALLLFAVFLANPTSIRAAEVEGDAALSAPLTELVGQLAARAQPSASDYADLARATIAYGQRAQTSQAPIVEGAIRDALAASKAGEALDPNTADWANLRSQLEALLPKENPPPEKKDNSDEKKPDQNKKDPSDDKNEKGDEGESDKNEAQDKSEQSQDQQKKKDSGEPNESKSDNNQQSDGDDPSSDQNPSKPDSQKKPDSPGQSAFGEMPTDEPPPPKKSDGATEQPDPESSSSSEMQEVGGAASDASTDPARLDPSLAIPLQKLDQVKQGDSPAQLFQLLQGPPTEPAPNGKNW